MEEKGSLFLKKYLYIYFLFPFQIYFIFFLEIEHSLDTFTVYYVSQIVDELTISPLIRKCEKVWDAQTFLLSAFLHAGL